jgi:hypothetical protein
MENKFVEILQDGAALISKRDPQMGVFTGDLESCVIHVFIGKDASLFVHDTAQLSLNSIKNLIGKCGTLTQWFSVFNADCMKPGGSYAQTIGEKYRSLQMEKHEKRRKEIRDKAKVSIAWRERWVKGDRVLIGKDGSMRVSPDHGTFLPIPNKEVRYGILRLNNMFSPLDAQQIKTDLQFTKGQFTDPPALLFTVEKLMRDAETHAAGGDLDYRNCLTNSAAALQYAGAIAPVQS